MGGKNPYIQETQYKPATRKFKVTFQVDGESKEVEVLVELWVPIHK